MSSVEEDVAEVLISEIESRPALWNTKLASYKNKHLRDKLYTEVGETLGISKETVAAKWKNKKDTYRRELKKLGTSRSGQAANSNSSTWPYFEMMSFMKDLMTPAPKYGNLSSTQDDTIIDSEVDDNSETQSIDPTSPAPTNISELSEPHTITRPPSASSSSTTKTETKTNRKRLCDTRDDRFLELENKKLQILSQTLVQDVPPQESEDLNFFKSLIPYMERLQPIRKLMVRNKIQQIIIDEISLNEGRRPGGGPENQPAAQYSNLTPLATGSSSEEGTPYSFTSFGQYQY